MEMSQVGYVDVDITSLILRLLTQRRTLEKVHEVRALGSR